MKQDGVYEVISFTIKEVRTRTSTVTRHGQAGRGAYQRMRTLPLRKPIAIPPSSAHMAQREAAVAKAQADQER